jgi:hypothetical protein
MGTQINQSQNHLKVRGGVVVSIDHPGCRFCGTLNLLIDLPMRSCVGFVTGVKLDEKRSTSDCDGM